MPKHRQFDAATYYEAMASGLSTDEARARALQVEYWQSHTRGLTTRERNAMARELKLVNPKPWLDE